MTSEVPEPGERRTLGRTAAWLSKQVEVGLGQVDLSLPQFRVLGFLEERSAVSSDLAQRLAVRPPSVTAIIDGLVTRGLVERQSVAADRRQVAHVLTDEGRQVLAAADIAVNDQLCFIAQNLDDASDQDRAFEGLLTWRTALRRAYQMEQLEAP